MRQLPVVSVIPQKRGGALHVLEWGAESGRIVDDPECPRHRVGKDGLIPAIGEDKRDIGRAAQIGPQSLRVPVVTGYVAY